MNKETYVRLQVDQEYGPDRFWRAFEEKWPEIQWRQDESAVVTTAKAGTVRQWCEEQPDWGQGPSYAPNCILFSEEEEEIREEEIIRNAIGSDEVRQYLTAPRNWRLGVYRDGSTGCSPAVGSEIAKDERPLAVVRCLGCDFDLSSYREGWDSDGLSDEEAIAQCCEEGDMSKELEELIGLLIEDAKNE